MAVSPITLIACLLFIVIGLFLIRIVSHRDSGPVQTPNDDALLEDYISALQEFAPDAEIKFDAEADTIKLDEGERGTLFLGNMRAQTGELGRADQREKIRDFVRIGVVGEDPEPDAIRDGLLLRPRTAEELSLRHLAMGNGANPIVRQLGDLFLDMMCDLGPVMRGVTRKLLESAGLDEEAAFALAVENLRSMTPTHAETLWEELEPGVWAMRIVDDYSAARMIAFWPDLPRPIQSVGTVYMPTQGTVLLTAGIDPDLQHRLLVLGEELQGVQQKLSLSLYEPGPDGFAALSEGSAASLAASIAEFQAYEEQSKLLHQMFETKQEDVFIPRPLLLDGEEVAPGIPRIGSVLINGNTLLPQVDTLILVEEGYGGQLFEVDWPTAARILGNDRLTPYPALFPVRYDLRDPIPDDVMAALMQAGTLRLSKHKTS